MTENSKKITTLEDKLEKTSYVDSLYYQIRLTERYLKMLSVQTFEKLNVEISLGEFIVLDLLFKNGVQCQRDIAITLLKDRANMGRLTSTLESKKYIEVRVEKRKNRIVKNLYLTELGKETRQKITEKIKPILNNINKIFDPQEEEKMILLLKNFRKRLENEIEIQI